MADPTFHISHLLFWFVLLAYVVCHNRHFSSSYSQFSSSFKCSTLHCEMMNVFLTKTTSIKPYTLLLSFDLHPLPYVSISPYNFRGLRVHDNCDQFLFPSMREKQLLVFVCNNIYGKHHFPIFIKIIALVIKFAVFKKGNDTVI